MLMNLHIRKDKHISRVAALACLLILALCFSAWATEISLKNSVAQVYFSPHGGCSEAIVQQIDNAYSEILVQAYAFTSKPIAEALVKAHKRGVHVEIILDKSNRSAHYSYAGYAFKEGIPTYIDSQYAIAHNKLMVIDRASVITGSFNFSKAAEDKNAENLLVIKSRELAELYRNNWLQHREHAEEYREI